VVKLADARDSKSRGGHPPCGFDSHLRHSPRFPRKYRLQHAPSVRARPVWPGGDSKRQRFSDVLWCGARKRHSSITWASLRT